MPGRMYSANTLLEWLAEPCEDVPPARRACVQAAHAVGRPRHLPRQGLLVASDHAVVGDRVVGGAEQACRDHSGAGAGAAGDVVVTQASCAGQRGSIRPGRCHPPG